MLSHIFKCKEFFQTIRIFFGLNDIRQPYSFVCRVFLEYIFVLPSQETDLPHKTLSLHIESLVQSKFMLVNSDYICLYLHNYIHAISMGCWQFRFTSPLDVSVQPGRAKCILPHTCIYKVCFSKLLMCILQADTDQSAQSGQLSDNYMVILRLLCQWHLSRQPPRKLLLFHFYTAAFSI